MAEKEPPFGRVHNFQTSPRVCFKTIKVAKGGYRRGRQRRGKKSFLFISGGKAAIVFQFEEQLFHQMTFFVCMPVSFSGMLGNDTAGENHNSASFLQPAYKLIAVIAFVCQYEFAVQIKGFQQSLCHANIVSGSAGEQKAQRIPEPIRYRMDFCGQASSAPSGFLVIPPFLAPLACWWILIVVLSSIRVVSSASSCLIRAARISSHTLPFVHARNRLYTLCHGPNRSGKSRHGIPVFSQYRIALSSSRLLLPGRPPCGFFSGGNKSLILFHCFSLILCLFMCSILSFQHFTHNPLVLKQTLWPV